MLPATADGAVMEKNAKGRGEIRRDNAVEKNMEVFRRKPKRGIVCRQGWRVLGNSKKTNRRRGKARSTK